MASTRLQTFNRAMLALFLNNSNVAGIGDATGLRGSSTAGSFYAALLDANGDEIDYIGYARQAMTRGAWIITDNVGTFPNQLTFPTPPSGTVVTQATQYALCSGLSGANLLHQKELPYLIYIAEGHVPIIEVGKVTLTSDEIGVD